MNDEPETSNSVQMPARAVAAFARELRRLAAQVERDLARNENVSALSALTAIKPLTGALSDAALSKVMDEAPALPTAAAEVTATSHNPSGYL